MRRSELLKAGALAGAVAAVRRPVGQGQSQTLNQAQGQELTPAQSGVDASNELAAPGWKPRFFDEHQNETLIVLSNLIIPATETPGAKEALANRYIDLVLAAEKAEGQK